MIDLIKINANSRVPKYQQIVDSIINNIKMGTIKIDEQMPSINMFSEEFYVSRDTVERAYNILKDRKIITSVRGKGCYIARTKLIAKTNILFLINKLSSYKMRTYNSFLENIGPNSHTDLQIYHCDESVFLSLIEKYKMSYDYYIIMPHFKTEKLRHISYTDKVLQALKKISIEKLIIMDNIKLSLNKEIAFNAIYQDFEKDIYDALKQGVDKIYKYRKIVLVYPEKSIHPYPKRILHGFRKFCVDSNLDYEIIDEVYDDMILRNGDLFITIAEHDLVNLVKLIRENRFDIGKDVGVISYNDTPLKELLGITVASTDFKLMGKRVAQMILNNEQGQFKVPFNLIERETL